MSTQAVVTVSTSAQLVAALKVATPGEIILLQAGTYSPVTISGISAPGVTIQSQSSVSPAVITGLNVSASSGVEFKNMSLVAGQSSTGYPFRVTNSAAITFANIDVSGSLSTNGLYLSGSNNISIVNSTFHSLANAIADINNTNVTIAGNTFHDIRSDGIDNAGSSFVNIANNSFTNFEPASSAEHPDAIQFWTTNTSTPAHDISITGNHIAVGSGGQVQGIFMKDEVGSLPYKNVTISNNVVNGEMWNGIAVEHAVGLSIQGNTVTAASATEVAALEAGNLKYAAGAVATNSWIGVEDSSNISLGGNNSSGYNLSNNNGLTQNTLNELNGVLQTAVQYSSVSATLGPLSTELVLTGGAAITGIANASGSTVIANNAGDRLYDGVGGSNTLIGGAGNDAIVSRSGSDTLTGGGGNNSFQILTGASNDVITDFGNPGSHNTLNLSSFISAGLHPVLTDVGQNTVVSFSGSNTTITLLGIHAAQLTATPTGFSH